MAITLLDYIHKYSDATHHALNAHLFLNWTQFKNYVDRHFGICMYIYYNSTFYQKVGPDLAESGEIKKIATQLNTLFAYDWEEECFKNPNLNTEEAVVKQFLTTVFAAGWEQKKPQWSFEKVIYRKATPEEVLAFFQAHSKHYINELDSFLNDLKSWFSLFRTPHAFYTIESLGNYYWADFGVLIMPVGEKDFGLTSPTDILFFQIGDDN
jgi:hypothetical protein